MTNQERQLCEVLGAPQRDERAVMEPVILDKMGDTPGRGLETSVRTALRRNAHPRGNHPTRRTAVRHDNLMLEGLALQRSNGTVCTVNPRPFRLRAMKPVIVIHTISAFRRKDKPPFQPLLRTTLRFPVRFFPQVRAWFGRNPKGGGNARRGLHGATQIRRDHERRDIARDARSKLRSNSCGLLQAPLRQSRVVPSPNSTVKVMGCLRVRYDIKASHSGSVQTASEQPSGPMPAWPRDEHRTGFAIPISGGTIAAGVLILRPRRNADGP